jgi:putative SOS response-associated peptidase YedK
MCGRFVSSTPTDQLASYFAVDAVPEQLLDRGPNYNTAPTSGVFVVYRDGSLRRLDAFRWGLVPGWAKDVSIGNRMINARAETLAEKPSYRRAFQRRRCIIPADGFYEWTMPPGASKKQPYFIHRPDGEPFAFAGLWEEWRGPKRVGAEAEGAEGGADAEGGAEPAAVSAPLRSCTIITTTANEAIEAIHDRMPVILPSAAWEQWLSPDEHDVESLGRLLVPAPPQLIRMHPVSTEVNSVRNKGAALVDPAPPDPPPPLNGA